MGRVEVAARVRCGVRVDVVETRSGAGVDGRGSNRVKGCGWDTGSNRGKMWGWGTGSSMSKIWGRGRGSNRGRKGGLV